MKFFDILDGSRKTLFCLVRDGYTQPLNNKLIQKILKITKKHNTSIDLRFNSNLLNPLYFELYGYTIYHINQKKIDKVTKYNWGNHYQFLLDICNLGVIVKVGFSDKIGSEMYVLGKGGKVLSKYFSKEMDV